MVKMANSIIHTHPSPMKPTRNFVFITFFYLLLQDPYFSLCSSLTAFLKNNSRKSCQAHTCNLSYSRGRDQEDYSSKPALAN
jgi:hypothetical protein